jgi:hypothetical protein
MPDFYLPTQDYIIEVKGSYPNEEALEKAIMLSEDTGLKVFLLYGEIPNPWAAEGINESRLRFNRHAHILVYIPRRGLVRSIYVGYMGSARSNIFNCVVISLTACCGLRC